MEVIIEAGEYATKTYVPDYSTIPRVAEEFVRQIDEQQRWERTDELYDEYHAHADIPPEDRI